MKTSKLFEYKFSVLKLLVLMSLFVLATVVYPANPSKFVTLSEKNKIKSIIVSKEININMATESELMLLNGIGQKKAKAIIAYRIDHGPFTNIKDIKNVKGISKSVYSKIKDLIVV